MVEDLSSGLTNTIGSITEPSAGDGNKFLGNGNGNGNGNGQGNGVSLSPPYPLLLSFPPHTILYRTVLLTYPT